MILVVSNIDDNISHGFYLTLRHIFRVLPCSCFRLEAFSTCVSSRAQDRTPICQYLVCWQHQRKYAWNKNVKNTFIQFVPYLQSYKNIGTHCNAFLWHESWDGNFCKMLCIVYCMLKFFSKFLKTFYGGKFSYQSWSV